MKGDVSRYGLSCNSLRARVVALVLIGTFLGLRGGGNGVLGSNAYGSTAVAVEAESVTAASESRAMMNTSLRQSQPGATEVNDVAAIDEVKQLAELLTVTLDRVAPDPVIASTRPQTIHLTGRGLDPGSEVAVSWGGKVMALQPSQVVVRDAMHMELTITTGIEPAIWAVQVSSPGKQRSNVLLFPVVASRADELVTTVVKKVPATTEKSVPQQARITVSDKVIQGSGWVAAQPDGHFALQLLAASERKMLDEFTVSHSGLEEPLASFAQQRGDKRLYVLLQGSYPDHSQAESAARALPQNLQPWIRDFAGIKSIMIAAALSAVAAKPSSDRDIKDTAWVWSQPPELHTIQLAGASDEAAIEVVMRGLSLTGELAVVQTLRNGEPWYVLIYGRFASKEAAQGALTGLPASVKKAGPWIRRFVALQDEIAQSSPR